MESHLCTYESLEAESATCSVGARHPNDCVDRDCGYEHELAGRAVHDEPCEAGFRREVFCLPRGTLARYVDPPK